MKNGKGTGRQAQMKAMETERDRFALKRTKTGLGLFTLLDISPGKRIIEYVGPILVGDEVDKKGGKYLFSVDKDSAIDGSSRSNLARYINHSCRPNAEAFVSNRKRVWIWSKKPIAAGEQITINYGKDYLEEHIKPIGCKCEKCSAERTPQASATRTSRSAKTAAGRGGRTRRSK